MSSSPVHLSFLGIINQPDTWDVVGNATFRQPVGYLEKGCNFDKTLRIANFAMDFAMDYFSLVGQMPILDPLGKKTPRLPNRPAALRDCRQHINPAPHGSISEQGHPLP